MRKTLLALLAAALCLPLLLTGGAAQARPATTARDGGAAVGQFARHLFGYSKFEQTGTSVHVTGGYFFLTPNRSYFTVVYANAKCDPAQAFPVGPFTTNQYGYAILDTTVTAPVAGLVGGTMSVSVRRADNQRDVDGDGKTGPTDVIAVAGHPFIGLQECDRAPVVTPATTPAPSPTTTAPTMTPTTSTPTMTAPTTQPPTSDPTETAAPTPTDPGTGMPTSTGTDTPTGSGTTTE